jgi:hypothetical protein
LPHQHGALIDHHRATEKHNTANEVARICGSTKRTNAGDAARSWVAFALVC